MIKLDTTANNEPDQEELKGFSRTIAEIEWLLLVLVMAYLVAVGPEGEDGTAIYMALFFMGAFILALHYVHFYKKETLTKLAIETWVMILFTTWVTWYSGQINSPLLNLYLLPIIASALILGKLMTSFETLIVIGCYLVMAHERGQNGIDSIAYWGKMLALIAPVVLVAYITTMLRADIRYAVARIRRISDTDELTGVYNMRAFSAILRRAFQQSVRHNHPLSVVMLDSDNLKVINDTHGHEAGNRLLQHVIRKVSEELRRSDTIARYGGDEFTILLPETNRGGALETAERIRKSIETSQFDARGARITTTVSLGLASYPEDGSNIDILVDKADRALYKAKQSGRNQTATYEIDDDSDGSPPTRPGLKYATSS
ncbi:MAG: GGDEF domain-containing protein [Betaproteobacteria bacterium]|jgi:diguanylate cyclase (GGDEF)-like protein|nr:MAG: GGDEF domain-containing protein [Betaproteobacteria bacterium]